MMTKTIFPLNETIKGKTCSIFSRSSKKSVVLLIHFNSNIKYSEFSWNIPIFEPKWNSKKIFTKPEKLNADTVYIAFTQKLQK